MENKYKQFKELFQEVKEEFDNLIKLYETNKEKVIKSNKKHFIEKSSFTLRVMLENINNLEELMIKSVYEGEDIIEQFIKETTNDILIYPINNDLSKKAIIELVPEEQIANNSGYEIIFGNWEQTAMLVNQEYSTMKKEEILSQQYNLGLIIIDETIKARKILDIKGLMTNTEIIKTIKVDQIKETINNHYSK